MSQFCFLLVMEIQYGMYLNITLLLLSRINNI